MQPGAAAAALGRDAARAQEQFRGQKGVAPGLGRDDRAPRFLDPLKILQKPRGQPQQAAQDINRRSAG